MQGPLPPLQLPLPDTLSLAYTMADKRRDPESIMEKESQAQDYLAKPVGRSWYLTTTEVFPVFVEIINRQKQSPFTKPDSYYTIKHVAPMLNAGHPHQPEWFHAVAYIVAHAIANGAARMRIDQSATQLDAVRALAAATPAHGRTPGMGDFVVANDDWHERIKLYNHHQRHAQHLLHAFATADDTAIQKAAHALHDAAT